jgi:CIC family chloride channel protein
MYGVGYPVMYKTAAGGYALWFLIILAFGKIAACSLSIGMGGSGGVFAPSLFIGVTSGYAYGDFVHHLFGNAAGQPALYAVVAMGAVFTAAARAPLTSLASVVEMTGDFALTLPVMLAVAIATVVSRALSYGTIYTTKLLRRGTDIDRAAPWRAVADLKITDIMRPFKPTLQIPPHGSTLTAANGTSGAEGHLDEAALPGRVTYRHDVQTLFASESLGQALRQLAVYGRDGLPVVSADARNLEGWVTNNGVLRAIAQRVAGAAAETANAQAAADWEHEDEQAVREHPSVPLRGYYVAEIVITPDSPAAGQKLRDAVWPAESIPVSVLHRGSLRRPHRDLTLAVGDRLSLLIPAARDARHAHSGDSREHVASREAGDGSSP